MNAMRRGACPGIEFPMSTGDGLLARLLPQGALSITKIIALCDAALEFANGVLEVTQRGSLQIRGLTPASAPSFARHVFAQGLGASNILPIIGSPLMGYDAHEQMDLRATLIALRAAVNGHRELATLHPKVSILLDGGGALNLDGVSGDLRFRAVSGSRLLVSIGGDAGTATLLGSIEPQHAVEVALSILTAIAARGSHARAHDLTDGNNLAPLQRSLARVMDSVLQHMPSVPQAQPIGVHELRDGRLALGVALAFGHTHAVTLRQLAQLAANGDATLIETVPDRALMIAGLSAEGAQELAAAAAHLGFIVQPNDPRRFVVACAGAPACGSAHLATRLAAPEFARAAANLLDGSITVHLSGCAKGCAHPGPADITYVGPGGLILQGRAGDRVQAEVSVEQTIAGLANLDIERSRASNVPANSAAFLASLGISGVVAAMRLNS